MNRSYIQAVHEIESNLRKQVEELAAVAGLGLEFIDHWVGNHSMDSYEATPRVTADIIRAALTEAMTAKMLSTWRELGSMSLGVGEVKMKQPDLTTVAAMNRPLAKATRECSCIESVWSQPGCSDRVARFPGFRQTCQHCYVEGHPWLNDEVGVPVPCHICKGLGWQVRAGSLEDALAGLSVDEACEVTYRITNWTWELDTRLPMPPADEILAKALELVIETAEL